MLRTFCITCAIGNQAISILDARESRMEVYYYVMFVLLCCFYLTMTEVHRRNRVKRRVMRRHARLNIAREARR